jgi:hypothetical protein
MLTLASERFTKECFDRANNWLRNTTQWNSTKEAVRSAVAEYIANQYGHTLYKERSGTS